MIGYVHSIESFGAMDGPGIRFVVFLEGCPMRCLYCHNPDTWEMRKKMPMTVEEIWAQYQGCKEFCRGGITVTGGEPLVQQDFVAALFSLARQSGVHTCLDTSGALFDPAHPERVDALLDVTNLVMLDIKHIDSEKHRALTGRGNENILAFAQYLAARGVPLWIRHVVVPGLTDDEKSLFRLGEFIAGLKTIQALDVLPYHDMGKVKYEALGLPYALADTPPLSKDKAKEAKNTILRGMKCRLRAQKAKKQNPQA